MRTTRGTFRYTAFVVLLCPAIVVAQPDPAHRSAPDGVRVEALADIVEFERPEVWIGTRAPALRLERFFKGEAVERFERGRVYVVELWATWCAPCIAGFPHMTRLQERYADAVTFIGVDIWDVQENEPAPDRIERVGAFVEAQGERMGYRVAIEREGEMVESWLTASSQTGIPMAYIVDASGAVAWMGSPMDIDAPLADVVSGEHDYEKTAESLRHGLFVVQADQAFREGVRSPDEDEAARAYRIGRALAREDYAGEWGRQNLMAWHVLHDDQIVHRDLGFAYEIARNAYELSEGEKAIALYCYALASFRVGQREQAVELQTRAIELLEHEQMRGMFEDRLAEYSREE